ncbi:MAG: MarR family transcriptional regulator [Candidatus Cohnella colombiensis]|uniref:MarR family transcriptional regulator n=1 Tax=Candidatus Cohnella colombiensis TaxID=3121368 RepID=A0AA95EXJ1_9BACL|nr:MAG: MarR family transcriptional regulator [Cohnella sp.]
MDSNPRFELTVLFKDVIHHIKQKWGKALGDDLSITQTRLIYVLQHDGPQKTVELAHRLRVTPGAITGMADKLTKLGFVERVRGDDDRRVVMLHVTKKGAERIEFLKATQMEVIETVLGDLSEEDMRHLKRIFTHILMSDSKKE